MAQINAVALVSVHQHATRLPLALATSFLVAAITGLSPNSVRADEGGVSMWVPGFFGSLAATPQQPGLSFISMGYHTSVEAGGDVAFARQVNRGNLTVPFTGTLNANLKAKADLYLGAVTYVFTQSFLGAQPAVAFLVPYGRTQAEVDATLTGALGPLGFAISGGRSDLISGFGDPLPMFTLRWNAGVHNYLAYVTGNIPIGAYNPKRLANLGLGHGAIDAGGGYTYFNPQTGHEFSGVLGFTFNFENEHTNYQNGVDMHFDWGASQFLSPQWQIGLVGYVFQQISCDSGSGNRVGCFESRVIGVGPQIGHVFPLSGNHQGYLNLKGYKEFAAEHRPEGWNVWLTFVISPAAPHPTPTPQRILK